MKIRLIIPFILSMLIVGCSSMSNDNNSDNNEDLQVKETKDLSHKDSVIEVEVEHESALISEDYLITGKAVGQFKIGSPIPFPKTSDDYKITKETQTRMTEEGPEEETAYVMSKEGEALLQMKYAYDYQAGGSTVNIGEILVLSSEFKTQKGLGVNSTIEEFVEQYPDFKIWYTYISGMYVIEASEIEAQFILSEKDFIGKLKITSEITMLKKSDFKLGTKVLTIRLF